MFVQDEGSQTRERVFACVCVEEQQLRLYTNDTRSELSPTPLNPVLLDDPSTSIQVLEDMLIISKGDVTLRLLTDGSSHASLWSAALNDVTHASNTQVQSVEENEEKKEEATGHTRHSGNAVPHFPGAGNSAPPNTWSDGDARIFNVRIGPNYKRHKQKAPSMPAMYELVALDLIRCGNKQSNVGRTAAMLPSVEGLDTHNQYVPPLFIINQQVPTSEPKLFGNPSDGVGVSVVMYFRIRPETCNELRDLTTASPAVKLFAEYCRVAPTDATFRGRFKAIAFVDNLADMGFPNFIVSYNAKPALITKTGTLIRGPNYLEMDINVHQFNSMCKKALFILLNSFKDMITHFGFVIEGRNDEELPERIFGAAQLNRVNYMEL